jgi:hypothetical protein
MQEVTDWLEKLGLSEYAQRFADNAIGEATDQGPQQNHRCRQTRAPNVRFDPLASPGLGRLPWPVDTVACYLPRWTRNSCQQPW